MTDQMPVELAKELRKLPAKTRATVDWWLELDQQDRSCPLVPISSLYEAEYREHLPKAGGKKAPSEVERELVEILAACNRLDQVLTQGLSPYTRARIMDYTFKDRDTIEAWLGPKTARNWRLEGSPEVGPGSALSHLRKFRDLLKGVKKAKPKDPPHSLLIRWIAERLREGGRPKAHVLQIAKAIHFWATGEEVGEEWGVAYLRQFWR